MIDQIAIQKAIKSVIKAIDEDPDREGLRDTPHRVAQAYEELFSGIHQDPLEVLQRGFEEGQQEVVILKDLPFYSMCEHHLLPFFGVAHVGYIPIEKVVGLSKLVRVVDILSKRPQMQERFTNQIAECIMTAVQPDGVAVVVSAEHLCLAMRGVRKRGANIVTVTTQGEFRRGSVTRAEFLALVQGA